MKKRNRIFNTLIILVTAIICTSCNLFGLDLQQDFKSNYSPVQPKMNITTYEFIKSRKDKDMTMLIEAIDSIGYKDEYEKPDRTYILLNNTAFTKFIETRFYAGVRFVPKSVLKDLLDGCIIEGKYLSTDLTTNPEQVTTLKASLKRTLSLSPPNTTNNINYFAMKIDNYTGTARAVDVVTSNLQSTNGVMLVVDLFPLTN
jgi:hypothetical protein